MPGRNLDDVEEREMLLLREIITLLRDNSLTIVVILAMQLTTLLFSYAQIKVLYKSTIEHKKYNSWYMLYFESS